jgi:hypothetical protein
MADDRHYFTRQDAEIRLLTHPDDRWRGKTVDAPYFRITAAGRAPIHIWNYARRDGRAMSNESQNARLEAMQEGESGGAPFDDTALSDARYELQIMLNEQRFQSTYYQFRTMSEIGNVVIRYNKQADWGDEAEAGYTLIGGRVGSVGREVNIQGSSHPSVEITFEDMYPLGTERPLGMPQARPGFAPSNQQGGPGAGRELQAEGFGRSENAPSFYLSSYEGWVNGRRALPSLSNVPESVDGYDTFRAKYNATPAGEPKEWAQEQDFFASAFQTKSQTKTLVFIWDPNESQYRTARPDSLQVIKQKLDE